jgi:formylglycine-generating enzyme required for sulfatase activity
MAPYSPGSVSDPTGYSSGTLRVIRGGGCWGGADDCRAAYRDYGYPDRPFPSLGLRVVLSPGQ